MQKKFEFTEEKINLPWPVDFIDCQSNEWQQFFDSLGLLSESPVK